MKEIGIYIHIPFCSSKCFYCDFNSYAGKESIINDYFAALEKEIGIAETDYKVVSIFIGGGTPSVVEQGYIGSILDKLNNKFYIDKNAEITIESNPGTLTSDKLKAYRSYGINRLSMGLQSTDNNLLKVIGRKHSFSDFLQNYNEAIKCGFDNINADLMFSLPGQTVKNWEESLKTMTDLRLKHLSCYSLKIEEGTPFYRLYEEDKLDIPSEELDREMYKYTRNFLKDKGYTHYEISNFSEPGYECKHNLIYWKAKEYLGFGAGANSYINDYRFSNYSNIEDYVKNIMNSQLYKNDMEYISNKESMAEFMILGLRLISGADRSEFFKRYEVSIDDIYGNIINKFVSQGLLLSDDKRVSLTDKGLDLANVVMMEFL